MFNTKVLANGRTCAFFILQFVCAGGEMCNQHNLHRTGHIQICKQDIAG